MKRRAFATCACLLVACGGGGDSAPAATFTLTIASNLTENLVKQAYLYSGSEIQELAQQRDSAGDLVLNLPTDSGQATIAFQGEGIQFPDAGEATSFATFDTLVDLPAAAYEIGSFASQGSTISGNFRLRLSDIPPDTTELRLMGSCPGDEGGNRFFILNEPGDLPTEELVTGPIDFDFVCVRVNGAGQPVFDLTVVSVGEPKQGLQDDAELDRRERAFAISPDQPVAPGTEYSLRFEAELTSIPISSQSSYTASPSRNSVLLNDAPIGLYFSSVGVLGPWNSAHRDLLGADVQIILSDPDTGAAYFLERRFRSVPPVIVIDTPRLPAITRASLSGNAIQLTMTRPIDVYDVAEIVLDYRDDEGALILLWKIVLPPEQLDGFELPSLPFELAQRVAGATRIRGTVELRELDQVSGYSAAWLQQDLNPLTGKLQLAIGASQSFTFFEFLDQVSTFASIEF